MTEEQKDNSIYANYDKNLYRITGSETTDSVMNMLRSDPSESMAANSVSVPADALGSGVDTSTTVTTTGSVQAGKKSYDNTAPGFIMGVDPKDGMAKLFIGNTTNYLNWDGTNMAMSGTLTVAQSYVNGSSLQIKSSGIEFDYNNSLNGLIYMNSMSSPFSGGNMTLQVGPITGSLPSVSGINVNITVTGDNAGDVTPGNGDTINLGNASNFWNDVSYKTLTDRGCLGWFDVGVEMQDGRTVSDVEAIKSIQRHPTRNTVYGVPMLDYSSMPKAVYKPAPIADRDVYDKDGRVRFKQGEKMGQDGAETTALISIMLGSIKELALRVEALEAQVQKGKAGI